MGRQRVYVAIVFIPLFYFLVRYLPPWIFFLLVTGGILLGLHEFYGMYFRGEKRHEIPIGISAGGLAALTLSVGGVESWLTLMTGLVMALLLVEFCLARDMTRGMADGAVLVTGVLYVAGLLGHLILLRRLEGGEYLVFFVFLVTWAGDTGAYYSGKMLGRRKLAPVTSPNKTVEGAIGGLGLSVAASFLGKSWFLPSISVADALGLGIGLGILGQLGDLTESMFKRGAGVKDSSRLIPAHGGLLDRVDSLIFTAPALFHYLIWIKQYGRGISI
jgi:phosphatidate cytidylyltransferase